MKVISIYKFFILIILFYSNYGYCQNQANIWKCGANTGLDFNTIPPTPISGQTNNADNSSSISDASGNLLFYTDGSNVWNTNNIIMPNGSGLISNFTAGQCCLIVPIPLSNKYVIFSNTEYSSPGQLHYSVVDMSLNSSLGDIIISQKNISLGTGWTEKLCAYYNPSCNYYWVLMHKWNNDQFVALKVDASGVTTTSVTTSIGTIHNCGTYSGTHDAMGQLTISKDGQKVVNALTCQDKFDLFDFDINTGILSNFISIPGNGGSAWGTGFSADSKKLFVNSIFGAEVFQYDISISTSAAILSSKVSLYNTGSAGYNFGYMELGPDNKMYIPRPSSSYFSVINSPNNLGVTAGFSYNGLNISPYNNTHGISRIAYNIAGIGINTGTFSITPYITNIMCNGASNGSATVTTSGTGPYNYIWTPGGYTTSSVSNLSPGTYTVSMSDGGCNSSATIVTITQPPVLTSSLTSTSYTICKNQPIILNSIVSGGTPSYSVNWNIGAVNTTSIISSPSVTSIYSYTVTDANNCIKTQTIQIGVEPIIANFIHSTIPCSSLVSFTNTGTGNNTSYWNFGDGNSSSSNMLTSNNYNASGNYTVTLISTSPIGCLDSIQKIININANLIYLDFDFYIKNAQCSDSVSFINKSIGATSYLWLFGNGNISTQIAPFTVFSSGNYQVTLIGSNLGCTDSINKTVNIASLTNFSNGNIPNVFTPNNDGINDLFDFKMIDKCNDFDLEIFNRWGISLLKSNSHKQSFWDGRTTSGESVPDGTYFFIMNTSSGTKIKGTITLFK